MQSACVGISVELLFCVWRRARRRAIIYISRSFPDKYIRLEPCVFTQKYQYYSNVTCVQNDINTYVRHGKYLYCA